MGKASGWTRRFVQRARGIIPSFPPRQTISPAPYAIFAESVSVANIVGTLPESQLPQDVVTNDASDVSLSGIFTGDGSGLTNLSVPVVNVLTAGVTNSGVTDVTAPLQALLNKGGCFYFPPGRYLSQELVLTNNTTLLGSGSLGSVLVYANNGSNTNVFVRCMLNTNISDSWSWI
jgi:hypothetical protein